MFSGSSLTASIGVAHFPIDGEDAEELLAEADRRMYKEKRSRENSPRALGPAWKTEWPAIVQ
jgi:GGDEF domain-containing protein